MADGLKQHGWAKPAATVAAVITIGSLLALLLAGVLLAATNPSASERDILAGVVLILAAAGLAAWTIVAAGLVAVILQAAADTHNLSGRIERVESLLSSQDESLRKLIDLASLSDKAKSLLYRERELEALLETIHSDLARQDYESAEGLIQKVEQSGYADIAQRMRREIEQTRKAGDQGKVQAAIARVEQSIESHDWARAHREAKRLLPLFPDHQDVQRLPQRIEQARNQVKRDLLQQYGEAVRKNDIETGIDLLKQLDRYLTPQEAAALSDSARGVFRAKLHQLGVQFAISVTDQRWAEAVETGEQIMRDYPNTRMAHEVREKIDILRSRAAG